MWLLPSRGRPHLVARLFEKGNFQTPGVLILDQDEFMDYKPVKLPPDWHFLVIPRTHLSAKLNEGFKRYHYEPWFGVLNDDHLPLTNRWDWQLVQEAERQKMAWPKDNYANRISTPVFDGELVRTLGWIAPPELKHFYIDDVHELIAECLGCIRVETVTVSHEHVNKGRMEADRTYRERPPPNEDRVAYLQWCKEKWPEIRKKIEV